MKYNVFYLIEITKQGETAYIELPSPKNPVACVSLPEAIGRAGWSIPDNQPENSRAVGVRVSEAGLVYKLEASGDAVNENQATP